MLQDKMFNGRNILICTTVFYCIILSYVNTVIIAVNALLAQYASTCVGHLQVVVKCIDVSVYSSYKALFGPDSCHVSTQNNHDLIPTAPAVLLTAMFVVWVCITSKLFRYPR
jgi:hypothetical protein